MIIKQISLGFIVKIVTGIDDAVTRVPIIATLTKTRKGKIIFSIGVLAAIILAIFISLAFSSFISSIPYSRYISAALIFLLAIAIYFNLFVHKPRDKAEVKIKKVPKITFVRFTKLLVLGFITSFVTVLDDIIAYSSVLSGTQIQNLFVALGIILGTIVQIILVIYFSGKIKKIKYKEEISSAGLVILGVLILFGVI